MHASTATISTFILYLIIMAVLGWLGYRATQTLSDYILGGRRLGSFVTALSAGASDMSGWLLMGLPGAIYLSGFSEAWIAVGLIVGAWLNWTFVAKRLRLYTEKCGNALTLPDYFSERFEDRTQLLRLVTSIAILIFFTLYCASGVVAGARLFQSMFGLSYDTALLIAAVATISYVFIGGFLAVSWTDTVQASLMITALLIAPLMVIYYDGGVHPSIDIVQAVKPENLNMWGHLTIIQIVSLLAWGLGYFGQPHILVRFMAAKSPETIPRARRISMAWMILCLAGAVGVGFFGYAYFTAHPAVATAVNANSEMVFLELARALFNPWVAGFLLAAVLAAIMSTLSCQLLLCSSALTRDIYKQFLRRDASQRELIWFGRTMVLVVALVAIKLAWNPEAQILKMVGYAWAGFGAAFGPLIILSLFWRGMTAQGALAGIIVGATTVIVWKHYGWFGLYEILPGFAFSTVAIIVVSLASTAPSIRTLQKLFNHDFD